MAAMLKAGFEHGSHRGTIFDIKEENDHHQHQDGCRQDGAGRGSDGSGEPGQLVADIGRDLRRNRPRQGIAKGQRIRKLLGCNPAHGDGFALHQAHRSRSPAPGEEGDAGKEEEDVEEDGEVHGNFFLD